MELNQGLYENTPKPAKDKAGYTVNAAIHLHTLRKGTAGIKEKLRRASTSGRKEMYTDPIKAIKSAVILPQDGISMSYFHGMPAYDAVRYKYGGIDISKLPNDARIILYFGKGKKVELSILTKEFKEDGIVLKTVGHSNNTCFFFDGSAGRCSTANRYYIGTNTAPKIKTPVGYGQLPVVNKIEIRYEERLVASIGQDYLIN